MAKMLRHLGFTITFLNFFNTSYLLCQTFILVRNYVCMYDCMHVCVCKHACMCMYVCMHDVHVSRHNGQTLGLKGMKISGFAPDRHTGEVFKLKVFQVANTTTKAYKSYSPMGKAQIY